MPIRICHRCHKQFKRKSEYDAHLKRKKPCMINDNPLPVILDHIPKQADHSINELTLRYKHLQDQINQIKQNKMLTVSDNPIINHHTNTLQVLCVKQNDDYLNFLTAQCGDFEKAIEFVKNCALSKLTGDCKLLEKIYFDNLIEAEAPIRYIDKGQTKIEYFDEFKKRIIDIKGEKLGRILASNIQNTYLRGVNYLINNKFLAEYDIQSWNGHIYELSDIGYQKRLITNLDIPTILN